MIEKEIEIWLLHRCAETRPLLKTILLDIPQLRNQWADFKTKMNGWTILGIEKAISSLLSRKEVSLWKESDDTQNLVKDEFVNQIPLSKLGSLTRHSLKIESEGVRRWEDEFGPDWSLFYDLNLLEIGQQHRIEITTATYPRNLVLLSASLDYFGFDKGFGLQEVETGIKKNGMQHIGRLWTTVFLQTRTSCFHLQESQIHVTQA